MNMFDYEKKLKLITIYSNGHYDALYQDDYLNRGEEISINREPDYHEDFLRLYAIDKFGENIIYQTSTELFQYFNKKDIMLFEDNTNYRNDEKTRSGLLIIPANISLRHCSFLMYLEDEMRATYDIINIIDMKSLGKENPPIVSYDQLMAYIHSICPNPLTGEITPLTESIQR